MKAYISLRPTYLALAAALLLTMPAHAQWRRPPTVPMQVGADPVSAADIVGRDLDMIGLGGVGHVGIWTGNVLYLLPGWKNCHHSECASTRTALIWCRLE
ncbi:hypothetical protein [Cupriavidus taiwanensis]|uniref:hypothetical protein n=1 Tax=Cupriavidus taiwanensis TaxID=164546 RepID=UPI001F025E3C|nr:hypothetical protein [Cupriavidus taiwanensis]